MLKAKLFYFFYFAAMSSLMPYFAMYYESRGVPGTQIGILTALPSLITMVAAPLWSGLADVTRRHKAILMLAAIGTAAGMAAILIGETFPTLIPGVVLSALFLAPLLPIMDNAVLNKLGDRKADYGKQRLLGSLGPAVAGPTVSAAVGRLGLQWAFYSFIASFALLLILLATMRIDAGKLGTSFSAGLKQLLRNADLTIFLLAVFLGMVGYGANITYLFLRLEEVGASRSLLGFALSVGTIGELPFLLFSSRLLRRVGTRGTLICSLLAMVVMLFGDAFARAPWVVIALQLLHGTAFSGMTVAGVAYADEVAPPGMGATAQGMFYAVFSGIGIGLGSLTSSIMREHWGSNIMFQVAGLVALLGLILFLLAGQRRSVSAIRTQAA